MPLSIYFFVLIQLMVISYFDIKTKKIKNAWVFLNIGCYFIFCVIFPDYYQFNLITFFYPIVFLFVGFFLFVVKIMGSGDTKYLCSFYLMIPSHLHEKTLLSLIILTVVFGITVLIFNTIKDAKKIVYAFRYNQLNLIRGVYGKKLTFAPVIFLTWILFGWNIKTLLK